MPLYEYKCESCGTVFEKMQKFSDDPVTVHEVCGGHVRKLMSAPAFQFKGSGWYVTDYGKGGKTPDANGGDGKANAEKKSDAADSKSDSSKAGAKSEAKTSDSSKADSPSKSNTPAPAKPVSPTTASTTSSSSSNSEK